MNSAEIDPTDRITLDAMSFEACAALQKSWPFCAVQVGDAVRSAYLLGLTRKPKNSPPLPPPQKTGPR